jgi:hypothetical protein
MGCAYRIEAGQERAQQSGQERPVERSGGALGPLVVRARIDRRKRVVAQHRFVGGRRWQRAHGVAQVRHEHMSQHISRRALVARSSTKVRALSDCMD